MLLANLSVSLFTPSNTSCRRRRRGCLNQLKLVRFGDGAPGVVYRKLAEEVGDVAFDRPHANDELVGALAVFQTSIDQGEDFAFG